MRDIDQVLAHDPNLGAGIRGWFREIEEPHPAALAEPFR
jgi:hypothetical protein